MTNREVAPLVSCIMPTRNRRPWVSRAISYFLRQTYPNAELVILDDGTDSVADLVPPDPRIRYERLAGSTSLGEKRNLACEHARGDIILHWDDDDWMASRRIELQVEALLGAGSELCGLDRLIFLDRRAAQAWEYLYRGQRPWVAGGTLCYTRETWRRNPFSHVSVGEDTRFVWKRGVGRMTVLQDNTFYVTSIHGANTSPRRTRGPSWQPYPVDHVRTLLGPDWPDERESGGGVAEEQQRSAVSRLRGAAGCSNVRAGKDAPRLSIVLPVHVNGAPQLERTLLALHGQTSLDFEVIVAADGGDTDGSLACALDRSPRPYPCTLVESARVAGDLPHRNHARNAGCRVAAAPLLWIVDSDFILPPHAVQHAMQQHDRAVASGPAPLLSPCLARIDVPPDSWVRATADAVAATDHQALHAIAGTQPLRYDQYSGFAEQHRPGPPLAQAWPSLREGFPLFPTRLWHALGGFDERFIGWGGNKEEFVRRLMALSRIGALQVLLLRSVLALHQPHPPDPDKAGTALRRENQLRFRRVVEGTTCNEAWWVEQRERARAAVVGYRGSG